jgi:hypothetical protein
MHAAAVCSSYPQLELLADLSKICYVISGVQLKKGSLFKGFTAPSNPSNRRLPMEMGA